jgi:hypothetical protein
MTPLTATAVFTAGQLRVRSNATADCPIGVKHTMGSRAVPGDSQSITAGCQLAKAPPGVRVSSSSLAADGVPDPVGAGRREPGRDRPATGMPAETGLVLPRAAGRLGAPRSPAGLPIGCPPEGP